jgi:gas vesicle protein
MRRNKALASLLLGAGAYLLESMKDRMADNYDDFRERAEDLRERARDTYETAAERASRARAALRGEDRPMVNPAAALLVGLGVGVGVGLLLAPASGEETRRNLGEKVQEFGDRVRSRTREQAKSSTGTYAE